MFKARTNGKGGGRRPLLAGCVIFAATSPFVLGSRAEGKPIQMVELLLLESNPSVMTVGLHIEIAPGWHLYWINPGDAGLAPEVTWELPPGYEAGPLRYPGPEKIASGDIVAYGFKNEVLILCHIKRDGTGVPAKPPAIGCRLDWMACREGCVTGQEEVKASAAAPTPAGLKKSREIMSRFAPRFPKPSDEAPVAAMEARLVKSGNSWRVEILLSGEDVSRVSDFYPYPPDDFVVAHSRISAGGGKVIIPLEPSGTSATLTRIEGLLILGEDAYEVSVPVKTRRQKT